MTPQARIASDPELAAKVVMIKVGERPGVWAGLTDYRLRTVCCCVQH